MPALGYMVTCFKRLKRIDKNAEWKRVGNKRKKEGGEEQEESESSREVERGEEAVRFNNREG